MRIGYCPDFELLGSPDINCTVDVSVEWDKGTPYLVIDDVLVGKTSLLRNEDVLMAAIGARIADMAEDDARLLERAVEMEGDFADDAGDQRYEAMRDRSFA